jgi:hypothetical protein
LVELVDSTSNTVVSNHFPIFWLWMLLQKCIVHNKSPEVQCRLVHRNHVIWRRKITKFWRNGNDSKQPYCLTPRSKLSIQIHDDVYSMKIYMLMIISTMKQTGGFVRLLHCFTNKSYLYNITEVVLNVVLNNTVVSNHFHKENKFNFKEVIVSALKSLIQIK